MWNANIMSIYMPISTNNKMWNAKLWDKKVNLFKILKLGKKRRWSPSLHHSTNRTGDQWTTAISSEPRKWIPGTRHLERGINVFKIETYSRFKTYSKFLFRTIFFSQNSKYNVFRLFFIFFIFLKRKNFSFYKSSNAATINFLILATLFSPPSFHSLHHHFILSPIDFRTWTNDCFVAA